MTSKLHGARWRGHAWADEKIGIYNFLNNCADLMYNASFEMQSPYPYELPRTRLAMPMLALADVDSDDEEDDDDSEDEGDEDSFLQSLD